MKMFSQHAPLTDAELDRFGNFLKGGRAMNIEQLDGFFAVLIAGPAKENFSMKMRRPTVLHAGP